MLVKKRNGEFVTFNPDKIKKAILMAFESVSEDSISEVDSIVSDVTSMCQDRVGVENVQDLVEALLMDYGYHAVAKSYILYRESRNRRRTDRRVPDNTILMDYIHAAKYAKAGETYNDSVTRVKEMHKYKYPKLANVIENAFTYVYEKKVTPSMRSMQFGGEAILKNNARLFNCTFTHIDRPRVFGEIFWLLLCGCGVGYSVQWRHVNKLPALNRISKSRVIHYSIPDTIEGWADSVQELIKSYLLGYYVEFDYSMIRNEGMPLITSGGKAPGHLPLKNLLENLRVRLDRAQGRKLRPIECHDLCCFIAEAVLSGGIRRSSLMCLFSINDTEMLYCKSPGNFMPGNEHRMMANNSAVLLRNGAREDFDNILRVAREGYGEPGFFFTDNLDWGTNPCAEIGLDPVYESETQFGMCNLTGINCATCVNEIDFYARCEAAAFLGTLQAGYTDFSYIKNDVVKRDALLGVSLTGMMDWTDVFKYMTKGAVIVNKTNAIWATAIGINISKRNTCVKPSGTESLALGCVGSGIHPHHSKRYFRRVTGNRLEPVVQHFLKLNPHAVEKKPNGDYALVFPVITNGLTKDELSAREFVDRVLDTYENWILPGHIEGPTHNVSCTVTLKEGEDVSDQIWASRDSIAAMSFVNDTLDKQYPFAPREAITESDEDRWNMIVENMRWETFTGEVSNRMEVSACEGPRCSEDS